MSGRSVVVVGDILLDVDVLTRAERLTPDGPVPVLDELERRSRPGGAGLTAMLAARDGRVRVTLVAPVPDDDAGRQVTAALAAAGVTVATLPCTGSTPVKTRLRSGGQTVARLDSGGGVSIEGVPDPVRAVLAGADVVLVSDYGGGTAGHPEIRELVSAGGPGRPVVWDPHPRGSRPVPGVALLTPNESEAATATGGPAGRESGGGVAGIRIAAEALLERWQARSVAVTMGARGALLCFGTGSARIVPTARPSTGDACGAGDCFAATAAVELALGALPSEAVTRAVDAAGRFVAGGGVSGLDRTAETEPDGPHADGPQTGGPHPSALDVVARVRAAGGVVVATGGCFDLLHAGHIETLAAARSLGDCLVVCLNSDASVRRLKGETRPLQPQDDRVRVLAALRAVDAVAVFEEDTPAVLLDVLRPDIWVKGGDYDGERLPETEQIRAWGGEVVTVGYLTGRSTSRLVDRAQALE
jgi:rfaE bifunctional protein nucleotidyltransferase chain/domain/rfaE bifunctional protein kinase chain/domain